MLKILAARETAFQNYCETMGSTSEGNNAESTRYLTHRAMLLSGIGETCLTLGLIHFDMRLFVRAKEYAHRGAGALAEALGNDHPTTAMAVGFLRECTPYANAAASTPSTHTSTTPERPYSPVQISG